MVTLAVVSGKSLNQKSPKSSVTVSYAVPLARVRVTAAPMTTSSSSGSYTRPPTKQPGMFR